MRKGVFKLPFKTPQFGAVCAQNARIFVNFCTFFITFCTAFLKTCAFDANFFFTHFA
jgi:hypothetical protein